MAHHPLVGVLVVCAVAAAVPTLAPSAAHAAPAPLTVAVTTLADSGPGSLRAAINAVDAHPSGGTVRLSVAGTIALSSALPPITRPTVVDGTAAPGYTSGGAPVVQVDMGRRPGLVFAAGSAGSRLLGMSVTGASGDGITLQGGSTTLDGNYIGLAPDGSPAGNGGNGIRVPPGSDGNTIGQNTAQISGAVSNVISANGGSGILLAGTAGNTVVANRIGTDPAGAEQMGNSGNGITITAGSDGNTIGGTVFVDAATGKTNDPTGDKGTVAPVFVVPPLGNLVSGNRGDGVAITGGSQDNMLNGNFIGTTADGNSPLGNRGNGVRITGADNNTLQGCLFQDNPFVYYNVVSGNRRNGLRITDSDSIVVQANFFGIGADNTATVANGRDGIRVDGTSDDVQVGGVIPLGNVAAGNGGNGIQVRGLVGGFTTFNTFGGLLAFKGAAPNGRNGLLITATGGDNLVRTNVLSGNTGHGIKIAGRATGVTVDPNIVGLDTRGNGALPNGGDGIRVTGRAHGNTIGGSRASVIPQNTVSANLGSGVTILGRAHDNRVFNTYVGTDVAGTAALGNDRDGVVIGGRAHRNTVGPVNRKVSKLISGNEGRGVVLKPQTSGNRILRNYIGRSRTGRCLPNAGPAIVDRGDNKVEGNRVCRRPGAAKTPG